MDGCLRPIPAYHLYNVRFQSANERYAEYELAAASALVWGIASQSRAVLIGPLGELQPDACQWSMIRLGRRAASRLTRRALGRRDRTYRWWPRPIRARCPTALRVSLTIANITKSNWRSSRLGAIVSAIVALCRAAQRSR